MSQSRLFGVTWAIILVAAALWTVPDAFAQNCIVRLPPRRGATVLSTQIEAQAQLIVAQGEFLKSAAIARRIHAEAASAEMKNSVEWVQTYFTRRQMNREYRKTPTYSERASAAYAAQERRIVDRPWEAVRGDVTAELNWMLESLTPYLTSPVPIKNDKRLTNLDQRLSPDDIASIIVTEGAARKDQRLTFRIAEVKLLGTNWPLLLRDPLFDRERKRFESTRNELLQRLQQAETWDWAANARLQDALDDLTNRFSDHYSGARFEPGWSRRISQHREYLVAKQYLETLAAGVSRLILLKQSDILDLVRPFEGETCLDLLQFMCVRRLHFAPPEPGGEATYQRLFYMLQYVYKRLANVDGTG